MGFSRVCEKMTELFSRNNTVAAGLALLVAAAVFFADRVDLFEPAAIKAYDGLFFVKSRFKPARVSSPVVLIGIDDKTYGSERFRKPKELWYEELAAVIDSLVAGGARGVALDFMLPDVMFDDYIPGFSRRWLRTFAIARQRGTPVVTGYIDFGDRQIIPHRNYLQVIGIENLGIFNLTTDSDDFIRRHRLWFRNPEADRRVQTFSYAVARAFLPSVKIPAATIYIDYVYPLPAFETFSFVDVHDRVAAGDRDFVRKNFAGKIAFLGFTDSRNQDRFATPLNYLAGAESRRKLPGVEIHANIVNTLAAGRFYAELGLAGRVSLYAALALVVSVTVMLLAQRMIYVSLPLSLALFAGVCAAAFLNYRILPLIQGGLVIIGAHVTTFYFRDYIVNREKRRLRRLFQRYLPPAIVQQLLEINDADFFAGQSRRLCILFSDVRSFTTFSETRTPAQIVSRLNEYFDAMAGVVNANGGIVDKFIGDGLLAFFGVLDAETNPSVAGARTALEMIARLEILNREWQARGEVPFRIGVGLHTGEVMVGNIGSESKTEFTVIGDAVNLASRLEGKTKELDSPIVISQTVYQDVATIMTAEEKGVIAIKGRSPEKAYHLVGYRRKE